ncbi:hypothetical protein EW146_g2208 [Bondarzewia mesenterica]|uniref:Carrier domain-containing protein n=1 Tax=Bondarzewia mesenterica TaxID=1095465 RepID=A0A4S4M1A9_9AGAM|nr:hypothetical protein EW146_g2208 [Bondarzewia mesenterica]
MTNSCEIEFHGLKPVAIVGIAADFPSGRHSDTNLNHEDFFQFLLQRLDAYEKIPSDRFNVDSWKGQGPGRVITTGGAFLKNISLFDHLEFGITAKDAKSMAVSTRKLIELSFLALLDSGMDYRGRNVGCFMSGVPFDLLTIADADEFDARGSFAGGSFTIANRVSYHLDLLGPSVPTDTACSSSMTALHLAVQALRAGDCESAVVGGCQLNHRFIDWIQYSQGSILAPDGKCKPFDSSADGFPRGEGAAVIVVKLLEDALRDEDYIYASILGTAINSNGSAAPVNAPVAEGQADAMRRAYKGIKRKPAEVDFIELHATGTAAGDPIEANWVGEKFKRSGELLVGSVKGNIGHLEIAAFLASLSKVCSIFKYGVIPPNANLTTLNPSIKWDEYRLRVPTETTRLQLHCLDRPPLVSMCSSGIGGSNGHAVVEGPPLIPPYQTREPNAPVLILAGGLTPRSATLVTDDLDKLVSESADILAIATICGRRFRQMTWRSFSIRLPNRCADVKFMQPVLVPRVKSPIVFVIAGQGPQHIHMGRQLFQTYPVFRESILSMDQIFENVTGYSLIGRTGIFTDGSTSTSLSDVWPITTILPALAMLQMALIDLLRSVGVIPDVVIGHSAGETVTLYASGSSSKAMALELAIARGIAMSVAAECGGTMAAVSCTPAEAEDMINMVVGPDSEGKVEIACLNAPDAVALAGLETYIDLVLDVAQQRGFFARKIRTRVPVHSSLMDRCRSTYVESVEAVFARYPERHIPQIPTFSTLTGTRWEEPFSADYFWQNTRRPVLFDHAISSILKQFPTANFVEIGPHPALSLYIANIGAAPGSVLCPMRRSKIAGPYEEACTFLKTLGRLAVLGYNSLNIASLTGCSFSSVDIRLPAYPFAPKHVPYYPESSRIVARQMAGCNGPLNRKDLRISAQIHTDLAQHVIRGEPIMPAAGYLEMVFEFGARVLRDVNFRAMMALPTDNALHVDIEVDEFRWKVSSRLPGRHETGHAAGTRLHADGYMSLSPSQDYYDNLDIKAIQRRCTPLNAARFYETLAYFAQYGPIFRRVIACFTGEDEALVQVRGTDVDLLNLRAYVIHPAVLDACLHVMVHPAFSGNADRNIYYLPSRIESVVLHTPRDVVAFPETVYTHAVFREWNPDSLLFDLTITDDAGYRLCTLTGFQVARHEITMAPAVLSTRYDIVLEPTGINLSDTYSRDLPEADSLNPLVLVFTLGEEMELQKLLRQVDFVRYPTIWLEATYGMDIAAARGFSRSLRKELFHVRIQLVTFDTVWPAEKRRTIIFRLSEMDALEEEVHVDCIGNIFVPRLVPLPSPIAQSFDPRVCWVYDEGCLMHLCMPSISDQQVLIQISSCSPAEAGMWGFVGRIELQTPPYQTLRVHEGRICYVENAMDADKIASTILAAIVAILAIGGGAIDEPMRLRGKPILVTNGDSVIGQALLWILSCLGLQSKSIPSVIQLSDLSLVLASDIIISGFMGADSQFLRSAASPSTRLFLWNDPLVGVRRTISGDPWAAGDALRKILPKLPHVPPEVAHQSVEPSRRIPDGIQVTSSSLFHPQKAYVLVGGIGSLGIHCALWMYENGARNLVLTSRSGKKSLLRTKNVIATRMLSYLERLPDIQIRMEICDSTSSTAMTELFTSISDRIGGVILMSVVLADRLFVDAQTKESYEMAFHPKRDTIQALEVAYNINQLDFLIAISSASIFGNAGQTNYASANSLVDEMLRPYRNAFSLVAPAIVDSSTVAQTEDLWHDTRLAHWVSWAMSSRQVCDCIGDGIRMLENQEFWLYIPEFNWFCMQRDFGSSPLYNHLVKTPEAVSTIYEEDSIMSLQDLVLQFLDVDPVDFSPEMPLTAYGLDSLSAGRLSYALKRYISITQVQLLADISFDNLMERMEKCQPQD